ncbi:MAG: hypothetical protein H0W27_02935 [Actinobacteria bacterium]|nr:hypothetical protein [Actinomycetota bacterium]
MSEEPQVEGPIDLFVFSHQSTPQAFDDVEKLVEAGTIRFSARITGPYNLFTCHEVANLNEAHDAVLSLLGVVPPRIGDSNTIEGGRTFAANPAICDEMGPLRVKRTPPCPFEAFIQVTAAPGQDRRALLAAVSVGATYRGSCIVSGGYDILLELGAGSLTTLEEGLDAARATAGIGRFIPSLSQTTGPVAGDCPR